MLAKDYQDPIDACTILNPAGAQLLLDIAAEEPMGGRLISIWQLARHLNNPDYSAGLWHTLDDITESAYDCCRIVFNFIG